MIEKLTQLLIRFYEIFPLEVFVLVGSFIEEVIAPIPSPFVMTSAGAIASTLIKGVLYLVALALLGAVGKVAGAWVLYVVSDKAEDFILSSKVGKWIGFSHKEVESLGG